MSKNGKLLFRDFEPYITSSFGYRIHPITNLNTLHAGVDYGTNGKKLPTYAIENGIVSRIGFSNQSGNYVYINYPRLGKVGLYQHLDSISVKTNQSVSKNTIVGYVGATGEVTGIHLHFGWFNSNELNLGWYDRNWEDFEKYEYKEPIIFVGTPLERNETISQIEVLVNNLRARQTPNGNIIGYILPGIYNILETKIEREYAWFRIENDMWIAYDKSWARLYEIEEEI